LLIFYCLHFQGCPEDEDRIYPERCHLPASGTGTRNTTTIIVIIIIIITAAKISNHFPSP
jgi:hypothetical protein